MKKVSSVIITTILVAAIVALAFFSVISFSYNGGVSRFNSFVTEISMGSEFSGDAYAVLYPDGVISAADYDLVVNPNTTDPSGYDEKKKEEYEDTYVQRGSVYVDRSVIGLDDDKAATEEGSKEQDFKDSIVSDAEIIEARYSQRNYSSYSVSIQDDYTIKVTVPTDFTYAEYKGYDETSRSSKISAISSTIDYLTQSGGLSLRDDSDYDSSNTLISVASDINSLFKSVSYYARGGTYAIKIKLTSDGLDKLNDILPYISTGDDDEDDDDSSSTTTTSYAYMFVGERSTNITFTIGSSLESKTLYFSTSDEDSARDLSILMSSVISGNEIQNDYNANEINSTNVVAMTATFGENAAIWMGVFVLLVLCAVILASGIKYKKLGLVNIIITLIYAEAMILCFSLFGIELSMASLFMAVLGLALLTFTNFYCFEQIRKESDAGRTIAASVKEGYKKTISTVLDLHIVVFIVAMIVALVGLGEVAACGFIMFLAAIASYALYWFTRFMWYVIMGPSKDKYRFCGFSREAYENED
ncbi:MAG: hypothetical protein LUD51_06390 [Clostridia bacterium]|nr:hypothetical protein [Clostridia bacterium]